MKKIIAFILALLTVFSVVACTGGGKGGETSKTPDGTAETGDVSGTGDETTEPQGLPSIKYDGADYRVGCHSGLAGREFVSSEDAVAVMDEALYRRNLKVEEEYDINIKPIYFGGDGQYGLISDIINSIQVAQEDTYDILATMAFISGSLVSSASTLDWNSMRYTDLDQPYWAKSINDNFVIDGHIYSAVGSTNQSALRYTYAMMFNQNMGESYGVADEVFNLVDSKTWTIDKFNTMVSKVHDDVNGIYGFAAESLTNLDIYPFAFDIPYIVKSDDKTLECKFYSEKTVDAVDKLIALYYNNEGSIIFGSEDPFAGVSLFSKSQAMFTTATLDFCFAGLNEMKDTYVILPYPMYDEAQKGYYTSMMDNFTVLTIPMTVPDSDFVSLITEALNAAAEEIVMPTAYETMLKKRYGNDKYLDMVMAGRRSDFGVVFNASLGGIAMAFRTVVSMKQNILSSYYAEIGDQIEANLATIVEKYKENVGLK